MAEKKRKPNSAKYRQHGHGCSPDLNGGIIANGTSSNPDPRRMDTATAAAAAATTAAAVPASCDASDRLFYEELGPSSEVPDGGGARCEHACLSHRRPSSSPPPRLSRAALVATAALVVGLVAAVAVGVVMWHDHQRHHHHPKPRPANVSDDLLPLSKGVRTATL